MTTEHMFYLSSVDLMIAVQSCINTRCMGVKVVLFKLLLLSESKKPPLVSRIAKIGARVIFISINPLSYIESIIR